MPGGFHCQRSLDTLASRHRVIALDRPGFGFSTRPRTRRWTPQAQANLLRQALARLGVEHPVIVGHSWGAIVALALAIGAPDAVSGLVLVSGYYYPTKRPDVWLNVAGALPGLGDMLRYTALPLLWRLALKRAIRTLFAPAPAPDNYLQRVPKELIVRPSQIRAASEDASFMVSAVRKLAPFYSHLTMPVTLIAGKGDLVVDPGRTACVCIAISRTARYMSYPERVIWSTTATWLLLPVRWAP
ncbi:alpha/beta hydrolase [Cupriavidus sp. EM10]|nr:alpha/beta hydrolase [Cupriavidus sp. EM10]